jgi:transcriptional regulator with XRE-family HTH domain
MANADVKQRIRELIEARDDLSPRNVALKAGLSDSLVHKFLTKESQSMTVRNLEKIADAMGVSLRWVLFGDEAEVVDIWDRIPVEQRPHARNILETFAKRA